MNFTDPNAASKYARELFLNKGIKPEDKASAEAIRECFARCYEQVSLLAPNGHRKSETMRDLEKLALYVCKAFTHAE